MEWQPQNVDFSNYLRTVVISIEITTSRGRKAIIYITSIFSTSGVSDCYKTGVQISTNGVSDWFQHGTRGVLFVYFAHVKILKIFCKVKNIF